MITKEIKVNGTVFRLTLTDPIISQVKNLKALYNTTYEDPESFEQLSTEISNVIQEISTAIEPKADDTHLDSLIQEIIKTVDDKTAEIKNSSSEKIGGKTTRKPRHKK
uniref:Uncharacterized protein n=1 Tax=uncultured marine thaumarchaeote KM3_76_D06 TaxID=1456284 RepID=A0A075HPK0_9ARCH|nr:hypothetical protein [uncultured marine thaumarchaeote KM3_76_D06]